MMQEGIPYRSSGSRETPLDPGVESRLRRLAGRIRWFVVIEGVAWLGLFLVAGAFLQFGLDYASAGMRWSMRAALLMGLLVAGLALAFRRILEPLRFRMGMADVAHLIERRHPGLQTGLVSAVRFSEGSIGPVELNSPDLMSAVIASTASRVAGVDFDRTVDGRRMRRAVAGLWALMLTCALVLIMAPGSVALWFSRDVLLRDVPWPKRTQLFVDAKEPLILAPRGDDLVINAYANGVQPREVSLLFETADGKRGRQSMVTVGGEGAYRYRYTFEKAEHNLTFHLRGGDDWTDEYQVRLLDRPSVQTTEMSVVPPSYSHLAPYSLPDGQRSVQVLRGSRVTMSVDTNHPVVRATLFAGDESISDAVRVDGRYAAEVLPLESHTFHFNLRDEAGLENREQVRFSVQVIKDDPPEVRLRIPGVGEMITPEAVLPLELSFEDTYGLAFAEVVHSLSRANFEEQAQAPPAFRSGVQTLTTGLSWPVASTGAAPGERLTLYARAEDFDDVSGPNKNQSQELVLRVVTRDELLAELARREREYRADFERLVDSQEQLRGRLLTAWGKFDESGMEGVRDVLAGLERSQRNLAGSVNVVRQQFERILAELAINQLDELETRQRIGDGIVMPLSQLVKRDLVLAADTIGQWSATASGEIAARIDPQQVDILEQLRAILAKMVHREGYQEVVNMLRDIIRLQQELNAESKKALQTEAEGLFDE